MFAHWHFRHEEIGKQLADACALDAPDLLRCRVDALGLVTQGELVDLQEQVVVARDACRESRERILTAGEEVSWLDRHGLSPAAYLRALQEAADEGVVLLPHEG